MKRVIWLAAFVVIVMLIEGILVGVAVFSDDAREDLSNISVRVGRVWSGDENAPGVASRVSTGVSSAYREWVVPLWSAGSVPEGRPAFSKCISCHTDYAERRLFSSVYMNHPLHDAIGVSCDTCHADVAHPGPLPPEEEVCATCHDQVEETGQCQLCHPPGSLPHFYLLDMPRTGFVDCNTCHLQNSFTQGEDHHLIGDTVFDGSVPSECADCHSAATCQSCHEDRHPANWLSIHGQDVAFEGQSKCQVCHTGATCAVCHASTATNPAQKKPLPTGGR